MSRRTVIFTSRFTTAECKGIRSPCSPSEERLTRSGRALANLRTVATSPVSTASQKVLTFTPSTCCLSFVQLENMTTLFPRLFAAWLGVRAANRKKVRKQKLTAQVRWAQPFPRTQKRPERSALVYQAGGRL